MATLMPDDLWQSVTLPLPPSANRYWRSLGRGHVTLSAEAKEYRDQAGWAARAEGMEPYSGNVSIQLDFYFPDKRGDLDNRIKQVLDAMRGHAYEDDKQIVKIVAVRYLDKDNPRLDFTVYKELVL